MSKCHATSAKLVALLSFILAPTLAHANSVKSVTVEQIADSELIHAFKSKYMLKVELSEPVDIAECSSAEGAGVRVIQMKVIPGDIISPKVDEFYPGKYLTGREPCKTTLLLAPLRFSSKGTLIVNVQLSNETVSRTGIPTPEDLPDHDPSRPIVSDLELLYGDNSGKIGIAWNLGLDLRLTDIPLLSSANEASLTFAGETAAAGDSTDFKEAMKLETSFIYLPKRGSWEFVAKPIAVEADDDVRNVNYKGSLGITWIMPGSKAVGVLLRDALGCDQTAGNCTSNGLVLGAGYAANTKIKRADGKIDRSNDYVTTFDALWRIPLTNQLTLNAAYDWQSDSPDGSSSESSEFGVSYKPACASNVGVTISWINGEFMPGQQRRDAVRLGLSHILGQKNSTC